MATEAVNLSDIIESEIPDVETGVPAETASGMNCRECGKDIGYLYKGKGRKPVWCEEHKPNSASRIGTSSGGRGSADVKAAVQTLDMAYQALSMVLMMTGAHVAMKTLNESLPTLREQNAQFLAQDKDLVKKINALGKTGGRAAFFGAQIMVLGPVGVIAAKELRERFGGTPSEEGGEETPATMGGFPVV